MSEFAAYVLSTSSRRKLATNRDECLGWIGIDSYECSYGRCKMPRYLIECDVLFKPLHVPSFHLIGFDLIGYA
jgi:hypothetical protein